jgi:predicted nucleic acid-binding protein
MSAADRFFADSNLLLYSLDPADPPKQKRARQWLGVLWEQGLGCLSWQVLHECYANAIRKLKTPSQKARDTVEVFALWQPIDTSLGLVQRAWHWMNLAQLSYWDALIVAAAERGGCRWLLSEDFQTGRKFGDLTVVNPFQAHPEDFHLTTAPRRH